jgi:hypothetical protein
MQPTFSTNALRSLGQWLDHYMLQNGQAYTNQTTQLYYQYDPRLGTGFASFVAPFRSMVFDSGVSGAVIFGQASGYLYPSGSISNNTGTGIYSSVNFPQISIGTGSLTSLTINFETGAYISNPTGYVMISENNVFIPDNIAQTGVVRISGQSTNDYSDIVFITDANTTIVISGQQAVKTDFINGRLIVPANYIPSSSMLSGTYAFRDFNIYFANQISDRAIFTNRYYINSRFNRVQNPPPALYDMVAPCMFLSMRTMGSEPFKLGDNVYNTEIDFRIVVVSDTLYKLENALSLICDAKHLTFPLLSPSDWPLNFYNTYKTSYNYDILKAQYTSVTPLMITDVSTFKLSDNVKANQSLFFGGADITVEYSRHRE